MFEVIRQASALGVCRSRIGAMGHGPASGDGTAAIVSLYL